MSENVRQGFLPTSKKLRAPDDQLYRLLREGYIEEFNARREGGESIDLADCDLRNLDLRGLNAQGLNFSGCYFRQADLRGVDFSESNLEGASINSARISGAYFPRELNADEITLSLLPGTRMRYAKQALIN
jgi:uncharacterized protein YjbI with pentapeptide repeats